MSQEFNRLLVIGFDGASPDLLANWLEEGKLPAIQRLVDRGASGNLRSVPNMSSPAAWSSMITGKNPGKHGIFCFTERDFENYRYSYINGAHRKEPAFWRLLGDDRVVCVLNVPISYPAENVNGCMISGLDAPGIDSDRICHPSGLIEELTAKNGKYYIMPDFGGLLRRGARWDATLESFLDTMERRYVHSSYLMDKYNWDLFKVVFNETDLAHHFFWKFQDKNHPDYHESEAQLHGDAILKIYQKMDSIIERMMQQAPDATVIIVSDHGGGVNTRGAELINEWLAGLGLLSDEPVSNAKMPSRITNALSRKGYRLITKYMSQSMKHKLARRLPQMREKAEAAVRLEGINWLKTKAFCDGAQDDIWINLSGRDSLGIVKEKEYDRLCDFICEELREATDVVSGEKLVDLVFRPEKVYQGPYLNKAPDISIRWKGGQVINGIVSPGIKSGTVKPRQWTWDAELPSGGHSLDGIVLAIGPGIAEGAKIEKAQITDITPSILYLFDRDIPDDMDGKVIESMINPAQLKKQPPRIVKHGKNREQGERDVYSDDDSEVIEKRLQDLGYI